MGSLMRQLRNTQCDLLINEAIMNKTMAIALGDKTWAKRVEARIKRRKMDVKQFKITPDPHKKQKKEEESDE